jgi:hypothetical protein
MSLIRSFFWLSIFLGATFLFTVIFEHGFSNFSENSQKRLDEVKGYISQAAGQKPAKKDDKG